MCDPGLMKIIMEHHAISKETKLRWTRNKHINQMANEFLLNLQGSFVKVTSFQFLHVTFDSVWQANNTDRFVYNKISMYWWLKYTLNTGISSHGIVKQEVEFYEWKTQPHQDTNICTLYVGIEILKTWYWSKWNWGLAVVEYFVQNVFQLRETNIKFTPVHCFGDNT